MDELEAARRLGREGQYGLGLSVQEQAAYDQGRRERQRAHEAWSTPTAQPGGGGGFGAILLIFLALPAVAAPGVAVWFTWIYLVETLGWDWWFAVPVCVVEVVAFIAAVLLFFRKTPAVIVSVVAALYLGASYGIFTPILFGNDPLPLIASGTIAGAIGFFAGLAAPNKWMSSRAIVTAAAFGIGWLAVPFVADQLLLAGMPYWAAIGLRLAGAGLVVGATLYTIFISRWTFLGTVAIVAVGAFLAPAMLLQAVNLLLAPANIGPLLI